MDQFLKLSFRRPEGRRKTNKARSGRVSMGDRARAGRSTNKQASPTGRFNRDRRSQDRRRQPENTLDKEQKKTAGRVVHYTFGTLMGIVYGVSAELVPEATTGAGTAFGTLLYLGADEVAVPAFQLCPRRRSCRRSPPALGRPRRLRRFSRTRPQPRRTRSFQPPLRCYLPASAIA